MYEIIDSRGVIHSGDEGEMSHAFDVMTNPTEHSKKDIIQYGTSWDGDLKLVEIHNISR